jgi:hypothetical protein
MGWYNGVSFAVDGALMIDDISSLFYGPNKTVLESLAEKAGIDPNLIENAKTANDIFQGLKDLGDIVSGVKKSIQKLQSEGKYGNDAISHIEFLNFIQGQIDMQKHYWELMKNPIKKNVPNKEYNKQPMAKKLKSLY